MIPLLLIVGAYFLLDAWSHTYAIYDKRTGKRVSGSGYYYVRGSSGKRHRRQKKK